MLVRNNNNTPLLDIGPSRTEWKAARFSQKSSDCYVYALCVPRTWLCTTSVKVLENGNQRRPKPGILGTYVVVALLLVHF
jgi:hypothetical protein